MGKALETAWNGLTTRLVLLAGLLTLAVVSAGFFLPAVASASVDFVNQWPATPVIVSNGATSPASGIFKAGTGVNRLMIVAVATEYSAAQAPTFTVSYGGQAVTMIQNNTTGNNKIWLGYLKESGITAATSKTLSVTPSITSNLTALYATAAVFNGVDQTTPITGSNSLGITTAALSVGPVAYTMTGNAGLTGNAGMSVYFTNWNNNAGQTTPSAGYTSMRNYAGTNMSITGSYKVTTGASAESVTSTTTSSAIGALAGAGINPAVRLATVATCGDCHTYPTEDGTTRNVPSGMFPGSHEKHAGGDDLQYGYACSSCHYNQTTTNHASGFKNITGSRLPGNAYSGGKKIAITNSPALGTCSNTTCHSTGRSNAQYTTTPAWSGTSLTCLGCHAGRASATGSQANSSAGFKLSTTHSQHLKYPAANMNCNTCHAKTATDAATLKQYTGVNYHANGTANVLFTNIAYASYTSYKANKTCTNTACHGGKSRSAWSNQGAVNTDNTCLHCHGYGTGTGTALRADKYNAAPGWGGNGISTDGNTAVTDIRVGAHYAHLSSVYLKKLKCNECHQVPVTPFEGTHMATLRYNSQTLTFNQASTAVKNSTSTAFTAGTASTAATCTTTYCHGSKMPMGDTGGTNKSPLWTDNLTTGTPGSTECARCHGNPPVFGSSSSAHVGSAATISCNGCHKTVTDSTGKIINKNLHINGIIDKVVDTTLTGTCNKCHGNPPQGTAVKYGRYSGLVKPAILALGASPANMGAHKKHADNGLSCNACHNSYNTGVHPDNQLQIFFRITSATITGWNSSAQRAPYGTYSGNSGGITIATSSTLIRATASTNNSCNTYCHGGWNGSARTINPRWTTGTLACGTCHGASAAAPPQLATHARHAGYSSAATYRQGYSFPCLKCHPNRTTNAHIKGTVHVRFSTSVQGTNATYVKTGVTLTTGTGWRQYNTKFLAGDTPDGTCTNVYCHSNGRAAGMGTFRNATTPQWGTSSRLSCLACHAGRASAQGAPARSLKGFTLSTTHSQHLKYPAANINCQTCHSQTTTDAATLKNFSGVRRHVNSKRDVTFSASLPYGTYTSYKSSEAGSAGNTKTCNNVSCHGGKSRSAWSATAVNNDNTCAHCHGSAGTSAALANIAANRKFFAPGYKNGAVLGISSDGNVSSNDFRVGSHFKHISSIYMTAIKCNECHTVPGNPFDGTHTAAARYASQTLTFSQSSSARWDGVNLATLTAFAGYTSGTASKGATCSSVYCHGSRLKNGDTSGSYRKPYWNYSAMINYSNQAQACGRCHGNPPAAGSTASIHSGKTATTSCYTCHNEVVNSSGTIIDKTKHINGQVEYSGHAFPYPGATHATAAGTTPWSGCTACHTNGTNTTYPVAKGTAPDCQGCHKYNGVGGLKTPSGTSSCYDCHGASATDGRPNGAAFPNWSGNHTRHVVNQGMVCTDCHGPYGGGIGDTRHGFSNRTAHSFALGFVNVTSTTAKFKWARVDSKTGSCSTNACHPTTNWGRKFGCNGCHAYLSTDTWTSTYGIESAGAHVKHINYLATRYGITLNATTDTFGGANMVAICGVCHSINPVDHSMTKTVNTRQITFGGGGHQFGTSTPAYNGTSGTSSSVNPKSCSNTDCHFRTSPVWSTW